MTDILSLIDPVELTESARLAAVEFDEASQTHSSVLPYEGVDDIMYAYNKGAAAFVDEAVFRAYDAESSIGQRPSGARVTGEIPAISRKLPLSEYAQLRNRRASDNEIVDRHFRDADNLAKGIMARTARARAVLLETGKVTINENGYKSEYNSGRHASLTPAALTSTARWSDYTNADPVKDVLTWKALIRGRSGVDPTVLEVSEAVMVHLQNCAKIRGAFSTAGAPAMVTREHVSEVFLGLAGVRVKVYTPPPGMASSPRTASKVLLYLDTVPVGHTLFGTPVEASEPEYTGVSAQPGIYAGVWKEKDPVIPWTKAVAIVLPILTIPDATLCCQVVD